MSNIQNNNFSLLTQSEVDTLVHFLMGQKDEVDSSVLNQRSIDKLIELLRYDERGGGSRVWTSADDIDGIYAEKVTVRQKEEDVCELTFAVKEDGFLQVFVVNKGTSEQMEVTPKLFNDTDGEEWGRCIAPDFFNRLARVLGVKYTTKTHEDICARYAECIYGDAGYKLPTIFVPNDSLVIEELL